MSAKRRDIGRVAAKRHGDQLRRVGDVAHGQGNAGEPGHRARVTLGDLTRPEIGRDGLVARSPREMTLGGAQRGFETDRGALSLRCSGERRQSFFDVSRCELRSPLRSWSQPSSRRAVTTHAKNGPSVSTQRFTS